MEMEKSHTICIFKQLTIGITNIRYKRTHVNYSNNLDKLTLYTIVYNVNLSKLLPHKIMQ